MKSTFGNKLKVSIWGGSHEPSIGVDIVGMPADFTIDMQKLLSFMKLRAPGNSPFTTKRKEPDIPIPTDGFIKVNDETIMTTGETLSFIIKNTDARGKDYNLFKDTPRPGHADYTARLRYGDNLNMNGGGPFSGRMTAPLCIAGGIALQLLETFGITVKSNIFSIAGIENDPLLTGTDVSDDISMTIMDARRRGDTVGGIVKCTATGVPAGIGGAMYDGLEGILSKIFFGIPAVKGVEFGAGFGAASMRGSENNDVFFLAGDGIKTESNNAGGILGGISNGMPIVAKVALKPAPSISIPQKTLNLCSGHQEWLRVPGRHDPCIVIRAVPVVSSAMALGLLDSILMMSEDKAEEAGFGLIGHPLTHSFSKEIHEALGKYNYDLMDLPPEEMKNFLEKRSFCGLNVTIPYKRDVMEFCDRITPQAKAIGAVNTLYRENTILDDGSTESLIVGHNTDYNGFLYATDRAGIDFNEKTVLILGNGGTSRTARKAASDRNASKIYTATRNVPENESSEGLNLISYEDLSGIADEIQVIVNTTPVGTYPNTGARLISLADFPACESVFDVIYNPFRTALISEAEDKNLPCSNGLPMLVAQATAAAGYFLGTSGAFDEKNEKIIDMLEKKLKNIVLIGMPGSGKTTIGKAMARVTGFDFVDLDENIAAGHESNSIPEIFKLEGEEGFRARESKAASDYGKEHGQIIAAGGGVVLNSQNMENLRQNGTVIWIRRPVEELATKGRPLSTDAEALKKMYEKRLPLYEKYADASFDSTTLLEFLKAL